ncbi:MAG TPA: hypothetical protein VHQ89_11675 [Gaiellaceae bacterium]|nr:hypothetical protein [Gaiellaceae bacterium]
MGGAAYRRAGWVGLWFALFPTVEGIAAQALAAAVVIGSYFLAEHVRVRRPRRVADLAAT